jgi:cell division protein FtsI/penicillin-binding protein 2
MNISDRRIISVQGDEMGRRWLGAPGSTMKPLSLLALIDAGKLTDHDEFPCPGKLLLAGHQLNCSHPQMPLAMNVSRAIAYSCNCAVGHFAQRFAPGELAAFLIQAGLNSATVLSASGQEQQLQALGEEGVSVMPLELLTAYRYLARRRVDRRTTPILEGLEGAVEFGTAQPARLARFRVAGKTGSVLTSSGSHAAWFAGFAPSRSPEVAVVVLVEGRSGGADAAPVAGRLLREHFGARA